ncbi:MAG TPA: hypothetical protein PK821_02640 [Victivallales bacterium]|nr:hypothetical protein [Victivallales bacterium]
MKFPEKYSEFEWEEIFRADEEKIRKYMEELPRYIHVPGEDEIVLRRAFGTELPPECEEESDGEGHVQDEENWRNRKGSEILKRLLILSKNWLMIQNAALSGKERELGFKASASLAMATGRMMTAINARSEYRNFSLAHCKRIRSDLSGVESLFRKIQNARTDTKRMITEQVNSLSEISEMITDWILEIKRENSRAN